MTRSSRSTTMQYPYPEITILSDMIQTFRGGKGWTTRTLHDAYENTYCMLGAMHRSRGKRGVESDRTERYVYRAICIHRKSPCPEVSDFVARAHIISFNDRCASYRDVFAVIVQAMELVEDDALRASPPPPVSGQLPPK
jgi:hypothetical protein